MAGALGDVRKTMGDLKEGEGEQQIRIEIIYYYSSI